MSLTTLQSLEPRQEDTQSDISPVHETFVCHTNPPSAVCEVQETSDLESRASDTNLTPDTADADAPTIPSFVTIAEKFADEFWNSATTTTQTPTASHAGSPTGLFELVSLSGCGEDDGSMPNGDLIEHHEEASTSTTGPTVIDSNAEGEAEVLPDVERVLTEHAT